ncbi:MAG: hypothetical protein ACYC6M_09745 [Terriglobales bacterium]
MKPIFWFGVVVLIIGLASLVVAIPQRKTQGIAVGGVGIQVQTTESDKLPPWASGLLIAGGIGLMVAGGRGARS